MQYNVHFNLNTLRDIHAYIYVDIYIIAISLKVTYLLSDKQKKNGGEAAAPDAKFGKSAKKMRIYIKILKNEKCTCVCEDFNLIFYN